MFEGNPSEQPLIKNEYENNLKTIEELYLQINKDLKNLEKIFNTDNNELPFEQNNYQKYKNTLKANFNKIFSLYKLFENSEIENSELKTKIKKKLENLKNLDKKYDDFQYYLENLEKRMIEHVPFYQTDLINFNNNNNNNNNNNENDEFNNMKIKVYQNNEAMLKRTEQLEDLRNISSTVSQLSDDIKMEVNKQGEILNNIEENVEKVNENTKKGMKEIKETEIITKKSKKNLYFLCIIIIFLIVLIIYYLNKLI